MAHLRFDIGLSMYLFACKQWLGVSVNIHNFPKHILGYEEGMSASVNYFWSLFGRYEQKEKAK